MPKHEEWCVYLSVSVNGSVNLCVCESLRVCLSVPPGEISIQKLCLLCAAKNVDIGSILSKTWVCVFLSASLCLCVVYV